MNKDIINKYKKEFDAWLNGEVIEVANRDADDWVVLDEMEWNWKECEIRIKPKTRMIGDIECPMPLTSCDGLAGVFIINELSSKYFVVNVSTQSPTRFNFESGLVFKTSEDAITTAKALIKLTQI